MDLQELLRRKRVEIVRRWIDETLAVYPAESAKFLRETKDRFANPGGSTISEEIEYLFDALVREAPREDVSPHLDRIIQITCIQDVTAEGAVAFIFQLKKVLRHELRAELKEPAFVAGYLQLESRIDQLAMLGFDSFAAVQQRIADIRVREARLKVSTLMKMAQLNWDDLPTGEQPQGGSG